jgi:Fungal protein kinase
MIPKDPNSRGPKGFLIDLGLVRKEDGERSNARHGTGTMEFMAYEVLQKRTKHPWRHDLESFFYVLAKWSTCSAKYCQVGHIEVLFGRFSPLRITIPCTMLLSKYSVE